MLTKTFYLCAPRLFFLQFHTRILPHCLTAAKKHSTAIDMNKVYLRNIPHTEELHITFRYVSNRLNIDRNFNFCRRMNEIVDEALSRIRINVEKELTKRNKKKNSKDRAADAVKTLPDDSKDIAVELLWHNSNSRILGITFADLLANIENGLQLRIIDNTYDLVLNQPWVDTLQLPASIMAGFLVYPLKLDLQFATRDHSKGQWYRAAKSSSGDLNANTVWEPCGQGLIYTVIQADIGHFLKLEVTPCNDNGLLGPTVECLSKLAVVSGPSECPFEIRHKFTAESLNDPNEIRVVSYNLLADLYADGDYARKTLFPYCAPFALKIDYRKQLFIKEIIGYNADLLCLQEVDIKIFDYDLKPVLEQLPRSFHGIMAPKGACAEGIAVFYRTSRLNLVKSYVLHLGDNISSLPIFAPLWNKIKNNEQLATRIRDRSTTLQLYLFQLKNSEHYVLLANTHLYFHPDADHIRLLQIGFSLIFVEHIYKQSLKEQNIDPRHIGVVFCGDFNSVPECGIYKLMTEQFVDKDFVDWRSNSDEAVNDVELSQPFKMSSACGTPPFTNYTTLFSACLDYIFYQNDRFDLLQSVPLPTVDQLKANEAIPSITFPSDHVALIADLRFKTCS